MGVATFSTIGVDATWAGVGSGRVAGVGLVSSPFTFVSGSGGLEVVGSGEAERNGWRTGDVAGLGVGLGDGVGLGTISIVCRLFRNNWRRRCSSSSDCCEMPRFETNARTKTVEQRGNLSLRTMERTVRSLLNSNLSASKLVVCQNDHGFRSADAICRPFSLAPNSLARMISIV